MLSKHFDKRIEQTFTVLDVKGLKFKAVNKEMYKFLKIASGVASDNYPEILGRMFIVNAPFFFTGIWTMVKVFLDEKTRKKITILGTDYRK